MPPEYRPLTLKDLTLNLFLPFKRFQEVCQCWREVDGEWGLRDIVFVDDWGVDEKEYLVECLRSTINTGGSVFGAFDGDVLIGFASLENSFFGSGSRYLQLSSIHTSHEHRGQGIGRKLFSLICRKARDAGAEKLYLSAHSSKETQAFYQKIGCVRAAEINETLQAKEPFDCQLEFDLSNTHG